MRVGALPELGLADDEHLVVIVHSYSLFRFTHQGAPWLDCAGAGAARRGAATPSAHASAATSRLPAYWNFGAYGPVGGAWRARVLQG